MYAKLENGRLIPAPSALRIEQTFPPEEEGGEPIASLQNVGNPTPEQYAAQGWLPVVETAMPEAPAGSHYEDGYELDGNTIRQVWERVDDPPPEPPEPTLEEALYKLAGGV